MKKSILLSSLLLCFLLTINAQNESNRIDCNLKKRISPDVLIQNAATSRLKPGNVSIKASVVDFQEYQADYFQYRYKAQPSKTQTIASTIGAILISIIADKSRHQYLYTPFKPLQVN